LIFLFSLILFLEEQVQEILDKAKKVVIITTKDNPPVSRGFGFVSFESEEEAKRAVELYNGKPVEQWNSVILKVQIAYTKWERVYILFYFLFLNSCNIVKDFKMKLVSVICMFVDFPVIMMMIV
jgi:RNA recognition motif-containing protein